MRANLRTPGLLGSLVILSTQRLVALITALLQNPSARPSPSFLQRHAGLVLLAALAFAPSLSAAPEAHILRIDPRASASSGNPVITTVIEVQQSKRVSQATAGCATERGDARLACMAEALAKPLYSTIPFPEAQAIFSVAVDGTDRPAKLESVETWGNAQRQPGVGTAWLILVDADSRMGDSFEDAKLLANQFIASLGPNDIANVMFFSDRQVFSDSGWLSSEKKSQLKKFVDPVSTVPKQGRNRALLTLIKNAATDGFSALGNVGEKAQVPLHQAMVVLSTGFGGADPSTTGPGAIQLSEYMTNGRFPEDNVALPKTPVPVISVYFPTKTFDEFSNNSLEFMENLANPQIGGFFNVLQAGEGDRRAKDIVKAVRTRFSKMFLVKWRVSCVAPSITQTFRLVFKDVNPPIIGDASFQDVPVGIDPTTWPLDVNLERTQQAAVEGVYPGGTFQVYGDFCWGGDKSRAEVYFVPAGQSLPTDLKNGDPEQAKQAQQQLISMGMRGEALQAADTFAEFKAPDNDKLLHGSGSQAVGRFIVYDNKARRMSGVTAETIVTIKARTAPFPIWLLAGAVVGVLALASIVVVFLRGDRKKRPRAGDRQSPGASVPAVAAPIPAAPPGPTRASRAVLSGSAGVFTIVPNMEMRAGRDGASCAILIASPQVSSNHATLKLEGGQLFVRDENSNNGTYLNDNRIPAGQWTVVAHGARLRLGPEELSARYE
jgi:FHA domain